MGWQANEVWFDADVRWFREQPRKPFGALAVELPAFAATAFGPPLSTPIATGLEASRQRRAATQAARRRRLATRQVPAAALVLGSATMLAISALRNDDGEHAGPLQEDPPSLTFRFGLEGSGLLEPPVPRKQSSSAATEVGDVEWHHARSVGLPYSGRLVDGTQLPLEGADWVTWNPIADSVPNLPLRLYGNERTIRTILSVVGAYRAAHPGAPRVVIGDISLRDGGRMDEHVSHQNGLDVDVYYPRLDRHLSAPTAPSQVDRDLAQELVDRFVAAGSQIVFVGYSTGLRGPSGVVVPYPNHENHMHVRFPPPAG